MKINTVILSAVIICSFLPACVSKKKFTEMETQKLSAETRIRELTDENDVQSERLAQMISDFEMMKQELLESNARKDQKIGELNGQINVLNMNVKEKDATIEEKLYSFEFEKRRLEGELERSRATQTSFQTMNKSLIEELSKTKDIVNDLQSDNDRRKEEAAQAGEQIKLKESEFEKLAARMSSLQEEINRLQAQGLEKDATIERLNNNVKLLKSELGQE